MADQHDKTEPPTSYRLQEARERGQVPRSAEFTGAIVVIAACITLIVTAQDIARQMARATQAAVGLAGSGPVIGTRLFAWMVHTYGALGQALLPLLFVALIASVAANLIQTGFVFSGHPLKPDMNRLNPAQGLKRAFSRRTLWELGKLLLKVMALSLIAWMAYGNLRGWADTMAHATPHAMPSEILAILMHDAAWILGAFGALAVLDLLFVRREYLRQLRMSRRDLKDEAKRREGDPDVRAKRKRLMQELFKRTRSVTRVADADVVLSNPSHLSVALQYRPSTMRAPVVIAKGTDGMALRMREVAWRAGVPHVHSPELARALFRITRLDAPVPEHLFVQLAPIYRWLMTRPGHRIL